MQNQSEKTENKEKRIERLTSVDALNDGGSINKEFVTDRTSEAFFNLLPLRLHARLIHLLDSHKSLGEKEKEEENLLFFMGSLLSRNAAWCMYEDTQITISRRFLVDFEHTLEPET